MKQWYLKLRLKSCLKRIEKYEEWMKYEKEFFKRHFPLIEDKLGFVEECGYLDKETLPS